MRPTAPLFLLVLAPLVPAQISATQAVKEAHAAAKAALATFKVSVKESRATFLAEVANVESKFMAGTGVLADLDGLFASATTLQADVQLEVAVADTAVSQGMQAALADFANGAALNGGYPEPLQVGTGGVIDGANAAIDKYLAKTFGALDKRLDKTEALIESAGDLRLRATLRPPGGSLPMAASEATATGLVAQFGIDVLWVERDLAVTDSGSVSIAGSDGFAGAGPGLDVSVIKVNAPGATTTVASAVTSSERWTANVPNLARASYLCFVSTHALLKAPYRSGSFSVP